MSLKTENKVVAITAGTLRKTKGLIQSLLWQKAALGALLL
jgi:hypothetical protein